MECIVFSQFCALHGRAEGRDDGEGHGHVNEHSCKESQCSCRLRDNNNGVHEGVHDASRREDAEEKNGPAHARISRHVDETEHEKGQNVFQIVQMSPVYFVEQFNFIFSFNILRFPLATVFITFLFIGGNFIATTIHRRQCLSFIHSLNRVNCGELSNRLEFRLILLLLFYT